MKIISSNYFAIQEALDNIIIEELKAALRLLPGKQFGEKFLPHDKAPLCTIVVSEKSIYYARDLKVCGVWLDENDKLHIVGGTGHDPIFPEDFNEDNADWLNITNLKYLYLQMKPLLPKRKNINLCEKSNIHCRGDIHVATLANAMNAIEEY